MNLLNSINYKKKKKIIILNSALTNKIALRNRFINRACMVIFFYGKKGSSFINQTEIKWA